jgi:hypothetical protein
MNIEIEDFKTGWIGLKIGLKPEDIDNLIKRLELLKQGAEKHFHIFSDYEGPIGVGDIELYVQGIDQADNLTLE